MVERSRSVPPGCSWALARQLPSLPSVRWSIDFTRYDMPAHEPPDPKPGSHVRNFSLMNRLNQKGLRPSDKPVPLAQLTAEERAFIARRYLELAETAR